MDNGNKAINLFKYIRELYSQRYKVITDIQKEQWYQFFSDFPINDEYIRCPFLMKNDISEDENNSSIILQVTKPIPENCPEIPDSLKEWIDVDWKDDSINGLKWKLQITKNEKVIKLGEEPSRLRNVFQWNKKRQAWLQKQKNIKKVSDFFQNLRQKYEEVNKNSENIELMVGQGILEYKEMGDSICYPILLKKVLLEFDADKNMLSIVDSEANPEIATTFLKEIESLNSEAIKKADDELKENFYHPLDKKDTPNFLNRFANELSPFSIYKQHENDSTNPTDKIIISNHPVLFIRKRTSGILKSLDVTINEIEEKGDIAGPILNLIGGNKIHQSDNVEQKDFNNILSDSRGEDKDILLSKQANKEQLEIARNIEKYNAVLVQGPPGTGKTHTIANLMGHFLAQGKNILVTSHTKKALSVVKEKVVPELQNLCVSLLEDNNKDMERSVDSIVEYLNSHTSEQIWENAEKFTKQRTEILQNLSFIRDKIYAIQHKEYERITFGGKGYSVAEAAIFVNENSDRLSYIPGTVKLEKPLPLSMEELKFLYQTNTMITKEEEMELTYHLPNPDTILTPEEFENSIIEKQNLTNDLLELKKEKLGEVIIDVINYSATIQGQPLYIHINSEKIEELKKFLKKDKMKSFSSWQLNAIVSGKQNDAYKTIWQNLSNNIKETYNFSNIVMPTIIGKKIQIPIENISEKSIKILKEIKTFFNKGKKITVFTFLGKKDWKELYNVITINQQQISTEEDCDILISYIKLKLKRMEMEQLWIELIEKQQENSFSSLGERPEQHAIIFANQIEECLNWHHEIYETVQNMALECGLNPICIQKSEPYISPMEEIKYSVDFVYQLIPKYISLMDILGIKLNHITKTFDEMINKLSYDTLSNSVICKSIIIAIKKQDTEEYKKQYDILNAVHKKSENYMQRNRYIEQVASYAPEWADAIKNRIEIHGLEQLPETIEDAWKWKQFSCIIDEIAKQPFEELQKQAVYLSKELQKVTAKLAENKAWYHLLLQIEKNPTQKQALEGWKQTVRKIGKGTGKRAAALKVEAQKLMAECQKSVPAWIMPINQALENLNPRNNKFDIVIIDEASQSDISALAIFYLARKIIIVGDDEQVSPSGIGSDTDKNTALSKTYLSGIPNAHLYDMKTSLYDIAKTTFKTLMLKEHFRCVPSIINYSNQLSYNGKIKPLRDDSNVTVRPATVEYHVNGKRDSRKRNEVEAKTIVALMLACMEQPEYKNMTFGAISLLGPEQARLIDQIAFDKINPKEYQNRKILCGDASFFQGDERDVIFISLVDSNEGEGPLRMTGEGSGQSTKQRYNVAVSRAKDQIWIVHSLDVNRDLKPGDMRGHLITYMKDPNAFEEKYKKIVQNADSHFEISVASALVQNGYHIVQQWAVGAYRIDMVAICGNKKIAIECDGELYHSGEDKLREDMERQAILERLGWRFIRIRGSEYYRNPKKTISRVISELTKFDIHPEAQQNDDIKQKSTDLQQRIITKASHIMDEW